MGFKFEQKIYSIIVPVVVVIFIIVLAVISIPKKSDNINIGNAIGRFGAEIVNGFDEGRDCKL